jgi:hypothetical protein
MKRLFFVIAACASIVVGCLCLWMEMELASVATRCVVVFAGTYAASVIVALVVAVSYFNGGKGNQPNVARLESGKTTK